MPRWNGWILLAVLAWLPACAGDDDGQQPPREGAERQDAGPIAIRALPPVPDDPRFAALLGEQPHLEALRYLSETLLFTESEAEFVSAMRALTQSKSPPIAMVGADILSRGYHLATSAGFDIKDAIETSLQYPWSRLRRITVYNLGQMEAPEVRRWLQERLEDTEPDGTHVDGRTVAEEARAALARLDKAKEDGRSVTPRDSFRVTVATVGTPHRAPIDEACELLVEIESVTFRVDSASRFRQPCVNAMLTIVVKGTESRVGVVRLTDTSIYAGSSLRSGNTLLFVWCRPVAQDRVRCWYRAEVSTGDK